MNSQFPRQFAYSTGMLMISALFYVATYGYYQNVEYFTLEALITWLLIIIAVGNINFFITKRFVRKTIDSNRFPYVLSVLFTSPIIVQLSLRSESGLYEMKPILFAVLLVTAVLGAFFGVKSGKKWFQKLEEIRNKSV